MGAVPSDCIGGRNSCVLLCTLFDGSVFTLRFWNTSNTAATKSLSSRGGSSSEGMTLFGHSALKVAVKSVSVATKIRPVCPVISLPGWPGKLYLRNSPQDSGSISVTQFGDVLPGI